MHTINQVVEGWEVRKDGVPVITFPLKYFEIHNDSGAYIKAIEYVRNADNYGTYFDFSKITIKALKTRYKKR